MNYADSKTISDQAAAIASLHATIEQLERERDEAVNWNDIVDRHGVDQFDDLADAWMAMEPIQRVHNAVASVFSKWANDELMTRFKQHMANSLHLAFVEGCIVGVRAAEAKARALSDSAIPGVG